MEAATQEEASDRPQRVEHLLPLVEAAMAAQPAEPVERVGELFDRAAAGALDATIALVGRAIARPDDALLWFDQVGRLPADLVKQLARDQPGSARQAVQILRRLLLTEGAWGTRPFNDVNDPLNWIHSAAIQAAELGDEKLLRYVAESLFACEVKCNRFDQRRRTRSWLVNLRDTPAQVVADALRLWPDAVDWYRAEGWQPGGADRAIAQALAGANDPPR